MKKIQDIIQSGGAINLPSESWLWKEYLLKTTF